MATIPLTITGIREAQQQLEDLGKEFDKFKKDPIKSNKLAKEFNDLSKDIDKATASLDEMNRSGKHLTATFEEIYGDGIQPMTTQIGELEDRLYQMSLAGESNTEEFKKMSEQVVKLKTTIRETDKQIDLMTESKGLAVFGEGFSQIGASLLRLDFTTAGKDAEALNNAVGNLSKIGQQAFKGLAKTVGQLTKAFIKMGIALLANPIFWIAVAIGVVIGLFVKLADSLGILQPILDGIAYAFGLIKDAIDFVIEGLKSFLDWIGLTDFAGEESARKAQERAEKRMALAEEQGAQRQRLYDRELKLLNAEGKDTTKTELRKQFSIIKTAKVRRDAIKEQIKQNKKTKKLSDEEVQKLRDQLKETKILIADSVTEIKAIRLKANAEEKKENDQKLQEYKAYQQDRVSARRLIEDLNAQIDKDEIKANNTKYDRLIEDTKANEKLRQSEKEEIIKRYEFLRGVEEQKIRKKQADERKAEQAKIDKEKADALAKQIAREDAQFKLLTELQQTEEENEISTLVASYESKFALAEGNAELEKALQEQLQQDLNAINDRYREEEARKDKEAQLEKIERVNDYLDKTAGALNAIGNLDSVITENRLRNVKEGSKEEEKIRKNAFRRQKALQLSLAVMDSFKAITASLAQSPIAIGVVPNPAGIASLAFASATSALNIASIAAQQYDGGGSSGASTPSANIGGGSSTQQATPSFELFGQSNDLNNLSAPQDQENQTIQVQAVVSETEITEKQKFIKKVQDSASL